VHVTGELLVVAAIASILDASALQQLVTSLTDTIQRKLSDFEAAQDIAFGRA
jgi:type II secretory pathway pseudopilin PulG